MPKEWTADYFKLPTTVFYDNDRQGKIGAEKINEISKNIRVADLGLILDKNEDKDITDLAKAVGDRRSYKLLILLDIFASNLNKNAEFLGELNDFKKKIGEYILKNFNETL